MTPSPIRKVFQGVADRRQMFRMFDRHAQRLERNLEKVTGTLAGRVQESEEKIFLKLGPMSETVQRYRQRRPSAPVQSIAGSL